MMERHLAEELEHQRKAREATYAYNASQYLIAALEQTGRLSLDETAVKARSLLVQAYRELEEIMRNLEPKPAGRRTGKPRGGEIIDVQAYPDPFSEALAGLQDG